MRILRKVEKFADSQISFYAGKTLSVYAIALVAFALVSALIHPIVGLIVGFLILLQKKIFSEKWKRWWKGLVGEKAVMTALHVLSDEYVLINDLVLPWRRGNIDHFLVGPNGLFVLETKNYSGQAECYGDDWFVNGRRIKKSLSKQAKANAAAVRESLTAALPEVKSLRNRLVVAVLVFVNSKASLKINHPTVSVIRLQDLAQFLGDYPYEAAIPTKDRRDIVRHLLSMQATRAKATKTKEAADFSNGR